MLFPSKVQFWHQVCHVGQWSIGIASGFLLLEASNGLLQPLAELVEGVFHSGWIGSIPSAYTRFGYGLALA